MKLFRFTAQAQQQADQKQKTPECCCFNFLTRFRAKAVNQQQPEPSFIEEHERIIKELEYKVGHMEKGKVTTSLFSSGGMGKNGGGLFDGPLRPLPGTGGLGKNGGGLSGGSMGESLFGREALDAFMNQPGGSP